MRELRTPAGPAGTRTSELPLQAPYADNHRPLRDRRLTLLAVDVERNAHLAHELTLFGLAHLMLFRHGSPPARLVGTHIGHPLLEELDLAVHSHRNH